jgi:hypothetical protein
MKRESSEAATQIVLDLSQHCIETAARREHRRLLEAILDLDHRDRALEDQLSVLNDFLRQKDFGRLRAEQPRLAGGAAVQVELRRHGLSNKITFRILRDKEQHEEQ